ncbi:MAG TPA: restriction endonuclease [Solirubrobacterales bacterium]|nr:restriction endonuclease [Solirubrobacterales bacterium]
MGETEFTWRDYEDHIFKRLSEWAGMEAEVLFDQKLRGKFSEVDRQIDILIRGRFANATTRDMTAAVDCKYYTREIDVKKVDEFLGFIDDVQTDMGILVTNRGFTPAAKRRASRGLDLQVIVADIDRIPPSYFSSFDEGYYESEFYETGLYGHGDTGAIIRYFYLDPQASEYSYDPDHPPEQIDDVVCSGSISEITWGDDESRARCVREILRHRNQGEEPEDEDVKRVVLELAGWWEEGQPWTIWDGQLGNLGV